MKKEEKRRKLREILPLVWNSYQHMYDTRVRRIENSINFLLIIISFLSIISITLCVYFENIFFFIPLIFQLLAFIILLKSFFIRGFLIHWFEFEETLKDIEKNTFEQNLFSMLKALEDGTWIYQIEFKKLIRNSFIFIFLSLYSLIIIMAYLYLENYNLILALVIILTSALIIYIYYMKEYNFKVNQNYQKYRNKIEKWLKE